MENARRKIREVTRAKSCLAFTLTWEGTEGFFFFFPEVWHDLTYVWER